MKSQRNTRKKKGYKNLCIIGGYFFEKEVAFSIHKK